MSEHVWDLLEVEQVWDQALEATLGPNVRSRGLNTGRGDAVASGGLRSNEH